MSDSTEPFPMTKLDRGDLREVSDFLRPLFLETYIDKVVNGEVAVMNIFEKWNTVEPLQKKWDSGVEYFANRENGSITALIALKKEEDGVMYLDKMYIADGHQGKGLGTKAMVFAMEYSRNIGCDVITTHANAANVRAIRFYEKFGMKQVLSVHRVHDGGEYDYAFIAGPL